MEEKSFFCLKCQEESVTRNYSKGVELKNGCFTFRAKCRKCGRSMSRIGKGIVNTMLKKLPLPEMHMDTIRGEEVPGGSFNGRKKYSYCGPFTRVEKRIAEGYEGVNELDQACKKHDIDYQEHKDREMRNKSDDRLAHAASRIANDESKSLAERQDARKVTALIGTKAWLRV